MTRSPTLFRHALLLVLLAALATSGCARMKGAFKDEDANEGVAVEELYAREDCRPIIVVNGEFERLRSGYYPSVFYPKIAKCSKNFIPLLETAYYIRNFKGSRPGVVFRCYPGPWQVFRRDPGNSDALTCLLTQDEPISVRDAALMLQGR